MKYFAAGEKNKSCAEYTHWKIDRQIDSMMHESSENVTFKKSSRKFFVDIPFYPFKIIYFNRIKVRGSKTFLTVYFFFNQTFVKKASLILIWFSFFFRKWLTSSTSRCTCMVWPRRRATPSLPVRSTETRTLPSSSAGQPKLIREKNHEPMFYFKLSLLGNTLLPPKCYFRFILLVVYTLFLRAGKYIDGLVT